MEEFKNRLTQHKYHSSIAIPIDNSDLKQKFEISSEKLKYIVTIKLLNEESKLLIKSSPKGSVINYKIMLQLDQIKIKNPLFNIPENIKEAFKIFTNLLNKNGGEIIEGDKDSIHLILFVPNYINNQEDSISFELVKTINMEEKEYNKFVNNIIDNCNEFNISFNLIQKLNNLNKNNLEKELKIQNLLKGFKESLEEINNIKKDFKKIKNHIGLSDMGDKVEFNKENKIKEDEGKIISEKDEIKSKDEFENAKEEVNSNIKGESEYKSNDLKSIEYENKKNIKNLKRNLKPKLNKNV